MKSILMIVMTLLVGSDCSRILAFLPIPFRSHQVVFQAIIRELVLRGHEVTSVTPFPMKDPPDNLTELLVPDFSEQLKGIIGIDAEVKHSWVSPVCYYENRNVMTWQMNYLQGVIVKKNLV